LKLGTTQRINPRLEPGRVEEKIEKVMIWYDPADLLTRLQTWLQSVDF
jgi:hypothetical protein